MTRLITIVGGLLLCAATALAVPVADPTNPHNMSNLATHAGPKAAPTLSGGTDQICVFCHIPHSAAADTPLWSRPDPDTMGAFPVYGQALVIGQPANRALTGYDATSPNYPSGSSRMCLSCHDGATSIGVLLNNKSVVMETGSETMTAANIIDLATSHPISFKYDTSVLALLSPADYQLPSGTIDVPLDAQERMQCTTCHDPHEESSATTGLPFWRHQGPVTVSYYDDVCNECHTGPTSGTAPPIHNITP
jgi:hypothetical protein